MPSELQQGARDARRDARRASPRTRTARSSIKLSRARLPLEGAEERAASRLPGRGGRSRTMPARPSAGTEAPRWQSRAPSCPRLRLRLQLHDALLQRGFLGLCAAGGTALRRRSRRARGTPRGTVRKGPGERFAATGWRTALPDQANEGPASRLPKGPRRCGGVAGPQRRGPEAVDSLEERGEAAPACWWVVFAPGNLDPRRAATIQGVSPRCSRDGLCTAGRCRLSPVSIVFPQPFFFFFPLKVRGTTSRGRNNA